MATRRSAQRLQERKISLLSSEGQEGGPRELEAGQHHLDPWEVDETAQPEKHLQAHEGEENHQE